VRAGSELATAWPFADRASQLALAAHLRDQDDLHFGSVTHPGGVVWSAVAACSFERDVSVADAFAAAAFGYELVVRLAEAAGAEHRQRWHATATAGTVGAAGAAARLLGADEVDAVAHALSVAGGAAHAIFERTSTRFLHRAHATATGLACARAAGAGKYAGRRILDDGRGTFVLGAPERLTATREAPGIEETGFRLHPFTGFAHSAIDAALALGSVDRIEHVHVAVSPIAATLASNPDPHGADEEWWSVQAAVADALGCEPSRVEVEPSAVGWAAAVEVTTADGTTHTTFVTEPRGHPDRPAADDDLLAKWQRLNGDGGPEFLERIESASDADAFAEVIRDIPSGHA
jgi:2-methylcitrate dehydratase PrpD